MYCTNVFLASISQALFLASVEAEVGMGIIFGANVTNGVGCNCACGRGNDGDRDYDDHGEKSGHEASTRGGHDGGTGGGHEASTGGGHDGGTGGGQVEAGTGGGGGDCKFSERGREYGGTLSVTNTGKKCMNWEGYPKPDLLPKDNPAENFLADKNLKDAKNYCRNGDNSIAGPWCYIDNEGNWEACKIPYCPENHCRTTEREPKYSGKLSSTVRGHKCLNWATETVKKHLPADYKEHFPEQNLEDAKNYCRNADNSSGGPWCYIDQEGGYERCDLVYCPSDKCRFDDPGIDRYNGKQSKTASGKECLNWATHSATKRLNKGEPFKYIPDKTLEDAKNYCRNADRDSKGPWCYINDKGDYETCGIPLCKED